MNPTAIPLQRHTRPTEGLALTWYAISGAIRYGLVIGVVDVSMPPLDVVLRGGTREFALVGIPVRFTGAVDIGTPAGEERQFGLVAYRADGSFMPVPSVQFLPARGAPRDREYHPVIPPPLVRTSPLPAATVPEVASQRHEAAVERRDAVASTSQSGQGGMPPPGPAQDPWDLLGRLDEEEVAPSPEPEVAAASTANLEEEHAAVRMPYFPQEEPQAADVSPTVPTQPVPPPVLDPWDVLSGGALDEEPEPVEVSPASTSAVPADDQDVSHDEQDVSHQVAPVPEPEPVPDAWSLDEEDLAASGDTASTDSAPFAEAATVANAIVEEEVPASAYQTPEAGGNREQTEAPAVVDELELAAMEGSDTWLPRPPAAQDDEQLVHLRGYEPGEAQPGPVAPDEIPAPLAETTVDQPLESYQQPIPEPQQYAFAIKPPTEMVDEERDYAPDAGLEATGASPEPAYEVPESLEATSDAAASEPEAVDEGERVGGYQAPLITQPAEDPRLSEEPLLETADLNPLPMAEPTAESLDAFATSVPLLEEVVVLAPSNAEQLDEPVLPAAISPAPEEMSPEPSVLSQEEQAIPVRVEGDVVVATPAVEDSVACPKDPALSLPALEPAAEHVALPLVEDPRSMGDVLDTSMDQGRAVTLDESAVVAGQDVDPSLADSPLLPVATPPVETTSEPIDLAFVTVDGDLKSQLQAGPDARGATQEDAVSKPTENEPAQQDWFTAAVPLPDELPEPGIASEQDDPVLGEQTSAHELALELADDGSVLAEPEGQRVAEQQSAPGAISEPVTEDHASAEPIDLTKSALPPSDLAIPAIEVTGSSMDHDELAGSPQEVDIKSGGAMGMVERSDQPASDVGQDAEQVTSAEAATLDDLPQMERATTRGAAEADRMVLDVDTMPAAATTDLAGSRDPGVSGTQSQPTDIWTEDLWLADEKPAEPIVREPEAVIRAAAAPSPALVTGPLPAALAALLDEAELYLLPQWADFAEAGRLLDQVEARVPNHARVAELRTRLTAEQGGGGAPEVAALVEDAEQHMTGQDYWGAVDLFEQALVHEPGNRVAQTGLDRARLFARWPAQLAAAGDDAARLLDLGEMYAPFSSVLAAHAYAASFAAQPHTTALHGWLLSLARSAGENEVLEAARHSMEVLDVGDRPMLKAEDVQRDAEGAIAGFIVALDRILAGHSDV